MTCGDLTPCGCERHDGPVVYANDPQDTAATKPTIVKCLNCGRVGYPC